MKLPDFSLEDVDELGVDPIGAIDAIEAQVKAALNALRELGRSRGIEGDAAHHGDALRSTECLATSARTVANLRAAKPANDNATRGDDGQ